MKKNNILIIAMLLALPIEAFAFDEYDACRSVSVGEYKQCKAQQRAQQRQQYQQQQAPQISEDEAQYQQSQQLYQQQMPQQPYNGQNQ